MGKKNKLKKFAEVLSFPNVYENFNPKSPQLVGKDGVPVNLRSKWQQDHFKNNNPITLELACGGGEYTLALAEMYPDRNFIGVDIKGARIWKGAKKALERNLQNVAFLRTRIEQITEFFDPGEVEEIWITFPDPYLKKSKKNKRLTSSRFINEYRKILKPEGIIHLKTDEPNLYQFTLETLVEDQDCDVLYHNPDIYSGNLLIPELEFKTFYEKMHLEEGKSIKYVQFTI
jgi:tRNA (guanine-N7-)-methyltransferase